tara:strand:- start:437 stop:2173 length:1737 start_codon:yes stop_codon:yes gene_type:complete
MAGKTNLSATLFSQKKLLGKTSTGTHRADSNEPIPSGLQVSTSAVFAEDVPSSPSLTLNQVQNGTIEYVEFGLQAVTGSTYDANSFDSEASSQSSGPHAYRLTLPANYESTSNNTKRGTYPFVNGQILHWTLGSLQVVSPGFSNDVPNPFTLKIFKADDTEIPLLDEIDWQIDYFSGILFVQDYDSTKIPATAKGFIYTGKMLSQSLGEVGSGGGGSGTGVGWFGSGNGSISTSGSVYIGTSNTSNPEIFFSSVGAATFNEQGRNVDFRVETTGDQNTLFVQGSSDRVGIGTNSPDSLLHLKDKDPTLTLQREHNSSGSSIDFLGSAGHTANSIIHDGSTNDLVFKTFNGTSVEEILRLGDHYGEPNRQVIFMSGTGMHAGAMQPRESQDIAFYVSGAIGSKDSSVKGASVFGGDVVTSGSLTSQFGLSGSLTRLHDGSSYLVAGSNVTISSASNGQITISSTGGGGGAGGVEFNGGNGSNNQMITADGSGDIVAETNITFNGSQLNVSGDILPGSDNTFDLGSPTARFANIYTGDLHLRNERGHWQIVEEADALTVINRLTGKRYKMVLEPYEEEEK